MGDELRQRTNLLAQEMNAALSRVGKTAVDNSVDALNNRATSDIERMTTETARQVANFLYERDDDIIFASRIAPSAESYRRFVENILGRLIKRGDWKLAPDGGSWIPESVPAEGQAAVSSNKENDLRFRHRPPDRFEYEQVPLYNEITFIDLNGNELIKAVTSPRMSRQLKNVADRRNTYAKAETYFAELKKLKPGEIYVSDVIGSYVPSRLIGMYTPANAEKIGLKFEPEQEAYAGMENPNGKRFEGIVRWATPVVENGRIVGYVTLALNHDHIMEFTDHLTPAEKRYTELPNAYEGNYAFIWDYKCRSICHPRHHSIVGFDPETGDVQIPWLEQGIYDSWQASGKSYDAFIKDYPTFEAQSVKKKPARELTAKGLVGLDGRYLNFAPQCTGWFDLTADGGSGSFVILWSGLTKLTTAAAIPYYTGQYGASRRGFGFVAIGAGLDDFQHPAKETEKELGKLIGEANNELVRISGETQTAIASNLIKTSTQLALSTGVIIVMVVLIAIWMASIFTNSIKRFIDGIARFRAGERQFRFHSEVKDEMGVLADSFDDMANSIVDSVTGPLCIIDLDFKVIYMNDYNLMFCGKNLDEVVGFPYSESAIYPIGSRFCPITALREWREADAYYMEGNDIYLKGSASYLLDKNGQKTGYIIATTDVSEIVREQMKINEQRILLDTIFSSSPDLIWYKDAEGKYLAVNPRFSSIVGRTADEIIGKALSDIMQPGGDLSEFHKNDREAIANAAPLYTEEQMTFADGHEEILDVVRTPVYNESGGLSGLLGVARNVTARVVIENKLRHTQMELEQAVNDANRANEHKGEFLARMSHEIRTPMNAIIGMTNIAKRKLANFGKDHADSPELAEIQNNLQQIEISSQHLLGLLNDILDLSKIDAGKIELAMETVNLPKLANTVINIIKPRCDEKDITLGTFFETFEHASFLTDSLRLRQVLINLLGNAVKFTPKGGRVEFRVERKEQRDGKTLFAFFVRDTGIGIAENALPSIFNPFEQADSKITKHFGGTGLGLAISRRIVQLLGGDISVTSRLGEGSEFSFSIWMPDAESDLPDDEIAADATGKFAGKRALLVDDVAINRIIAMSLLETTGMQIDEADDGVAAVKAFEESPENTYDIIFMDVQMPNMDGYEASAAIRALNRPDARKVPIVALTANAFKEDIDKALRHGMNAHIAKPIELDKLLEVSFRFLSDK
ncbi:MAG: response regulator [Acidaminococcales bacterium]|nr:response regulator [Acidaminococcales bacterium]